MFVDASTNTSRLFHLSQLASASWLGTPRDFYLQRFFTRCACDHLVLTRQKRRSASYPEGRKHAHSLECNKHERREDTAVFKERTLGKGRKKDLNQLRQRHNLATDRPICQTVRTKLQTLRLGHTDLRKVEALGVCPRSKLPGEIHAVPTSS